MVQLANKFENWSYFISASEAKRPNFGGNPREEEGREKNERVTRSKVSKAAMNEENQEPQRSTRTFSKKNASTTSLTKPAASPRVRELAAKVLSPKRKSSIDNSIRKVSAARKYDSITSCWRAGGQCSKSSKEGTCHRKVSRKGQDQSEQFPGSKNENTYILLCTLEFAKSRPICHLFGFIEIKQKFKAVYNFLTSDLSL